jgi:hypothetical protein
VAAREHGRGGTLANYVGAPGGATIHMCTKLGGNRGGPKVDPAKGTAARSRTADDFARQVGPIAFAAWQAADSYGQAAAVLTERGIRTPGGGKWTRAAVRTLIQRHLAKLSLRESSPAADSYPTQEQRQQVTL